MAFFNGVNYFGVVLNTSPEPNPVARQEDAFPGTDGVLVKRMGSRGGVTHLSGVTLGNTALDVVNNEQNAIGAQQRGDIGVFLNDFGTSYPQSYIDDFKPVLGATIDIYPGFGWGRLYSCTIRHLI